MRPRDQRLIERASDLRSHMTDAEVRMWQALKQRQVEGAKFSRQITIAGYICDFVCRERKLVIEVDGGQHGGADDETRDRRLAANGYRVLHFWNTDVLTNIEGCINMIGVALREHPPLPLPRGEGI